MKSILSSIGNLFTQTSAQCAGIDIGCHSIKAVLASRREKGIEILKSAIKILPAQPTPEILKAAIKSVAVELDIAGPVNISLPTQMVMLRNLILPKMTAAELASAINFEVEKSTPYKLNDVIFDYKALADLPENKTSVLMVVARKDLLAPIVDCVTSAGLSINNIDVDALCIYNLFCLNEKTSLGVNAVINIGAKYTDIDIVSDGNFLVSRALMFGGNRINELIRQKFNITPEKAEEFKLNLGNAANVRELSKEAVEDFMNEIRACFYYCENQFNKSIERAYICGGSSALPAIKDSLIEIFRIDALLWDPVEGSIVSPSAESALMSKKMQFAVAIGLALRK